MTGPNIKELRKWQEDLEMQASKLGLDLEPLLAKRAKLREQIEAIKQLISSQGEESLAGANGGSAPSAPLPLTGRASNGRQFTPVDAYWRPTLESLVELGGSARSDEVIERVGRKMDKILTSADREMLPSGVAVRWQNRIAWQRENMKRLGLLRDDSPHGTWEITEQGRTWLANTSEG
jgi:hypothetical protein